jgi:hypothetical protein
VAEKAKQYIGIGSKWLRSAGTNIAKARFPHVAFCAQQI